MQAIRGDREMMLQTGLIYWDAELQNVKSFTLRKHWNQLKPPLKVPFSRSNPLFYTDILWNFATLSWQWPGGCTFILVACSFILVAAHLSWRPAPWSPPCALAHLCTFSAIFLGSEADFANLCAFRMYVLTVARQLHIYPGGLLLAPLPLPSSLLWALANAFSWIPLTAKYHQVYLKF